MKCVPSYLSLGGLGKLRRNMENTNGFAQANHREILEIRTILANMESKLELISTQVLKATFNSLMQGCDISEFFPVERREQLELFMDRDHLEWNNRKSEFFNFLFTIASTVKKGFARGLIKAIFSRQFIMKSKWPSFG